MLTVADALKKILEHTPRLGINRFSQFSDCLGQVLAENISSDLDSPPFSKSLRDGYALRFVDFESGLREFRVAGEIAAGSEQSIPCQKGEAIRIFTGAPIPSHADAIVMQEDCVKEKDKVQIQGNIRKGQYILSQGAEYRRGDVVLAAGTKIQPQDIGLLASVGFSKIDVFRSPRIGILSTGSEIVPVDQKPIGSQIRNSNGPMLLAQCQRIGASGESLGILRDDRSTLINTLTDALERFDFVIVSGGVSVGDHDHLPHVLGEIGVTPHVRQVAMKPGKPMLVGTKGTKMLFGLPGNPVSSFVCFELFVRPAIEKASGVKIETLPWIELPLLEDFSTTNDRATFFPAKLSTENWMLSVQPNGKMNSANLNALSDADAIISVPPGIVSYKSGEAIRTLRLNR